MKKIVLLLWLCFTAGTTFGQLRAARIFNSHAVLQRDKPVKIWGWSSPGERVTVTLDKSSSWTRADAGGKWAVELPARPAGGPYQLEIAGKKEKLIFEDIVFGEVWLCSGQSNMEWRLRQADSAVAEIAAADFPAIRHFEVAHELAFEPAADLNKGEWKTCNPQNAGDFTAVGYFFAREIHKKLGVPVGLIHSSWGGSQVESWISRKAMESSEVLNYYPAIMARNWEEDAAIWERKLIRQTYGAGDYDISGVNEADYLKSGYDFSGWMKINPVGQWDWQGIWAFRGHAFLQNTISVSEAGAGQPGEIDFGYNSGELQFFLNGQKLFEGRTKEKIKVRIPAGLLKTGANTLLIKTGENLDPAWRGMGFWGINEDFVLRAGSEKVALLPASWKMRPSWSSPRRYEHWMNNQGTLLYNAMIAPLIPVSIQGVLWYQGESNAGRAYQYRESFPLMINSWRQDWKDEFPFLFVQLSAYGTNQDSNTGSNWAELREAQTMTLRLPGTGMAVTTDVGNPKDIHPTNKQDVGHRLALNALSKVYGHKVVFSGPVFREAAFEQHQVVLSFDFAGKGFVVKDKYGYIRGFEIAGTDRKFYYAQARLSDGKILVSHPMVSQPKSVRYGWADAPSDCNLFNAEGLPAAPFRTDDWDGLTQKAKFELPRP